MERKLRVILSGGGTGGHIYPAVAVAEALKKRLGDEVELLFVGAEGKMEMEKVPALGYRIEGLPVAGLQRRLTFKNLLLPFKLVASLTKARRVIRSFGADIVVGFGGYASAPVLWSAQGMKIPTIIQEQNSYAGLTNKFLAKAAVRICVAYEGMERFFDRDKIVMTGNPLRGSFVAEGESDTPEAIELRSEARRRFGLSPDKPVVLVVGGSLGTRTFNTMMMEHFDQIVRDGTLQVIWQTGKYYEREMDDFAEDRLSTGVWRGAFIEEMDQAYRAADVVVARSGASTVSELCLIGKPTIFVPSPNVAEDHQTKNALALVERNAALLIEDSEAVHKVFPTITHLLASPQKMREMVKQMLALGRPDAAERIVDQILMVAKKRETKRK